jgi:hypothetical protein
MNTQSNSEALPLTNCSAFEEWWQDHGLRADPPVLEMAYKEIAFKGWIAAAEKCAVVCEFWGDKSRSVIITNFLPNDQVELPPKGGSESKKGVVGG